MKPQILILHGGNTYDTYGHYIDALKAEILEKSDLSKIGWKDTLKNELSPNYEILKPRMPNSNNATYLEWKIWFEKIVPFLTDGVILVGHSLGGIFLAKYLSENKFPVKIRATFLVAAPFDNEGFKKEKGLKDFLFSNNLELLTKQGGIINLYQSEDDAIVPFVHVQKYRKLLPLARARIFKDRGHFGQEYFPEIIEDIKKLK